MTAHDIRAAGDLEWSIVSGQEMPPRLYDEVVGLCTRAYEEDFAVLMPTMRGSIHVLGSRAGRLVSHALWVTRWLHVGSAPLLRTAFIEAVATDPGRRQRGYASEAMRLIAGAIADFDLAALSPFDPAWYARLGWEQWHAPLFIRTDTGLLPTPDEAERVMILRLPRTPPLDLHAPLSAEWREGELW